MSTISVGGIIGSIGLDTGPLDRSLERARGAIEKFGSRGTKLAAAAGAAIGAAVGAAVIGGINLEPARDKLNAQLGATGKDAEKYSKAAGKVFTSNWGDSMEEASEMTGAVITSIKGMREASDDQIAAMTGKVAGLSAAFGEEAGRLAQIGQQMITNGLAKDANAAFDMIAKGMQNVPAEVRGDLLDAIDEYGPFFRDMGISGEQAMNMLVKASEKGMFGLDKTGDAIKEFSLRAKDGSTATAGALEEIGVSASMVAEGVAAGGGKANAAMQKVVDGLLAVKDPAIRAQAAITLFGTPLEDLSNTDLPAFLTQLKGGTNALGKFDGAADQVGKTLSDNAASNLESFKRQVMLLAVDAIGGKLLPYVNQAAQFLATEFGPAAAKAGDWINKNLTPIIKELGGWLKDNLPTAIAATRSALDAVTAWVTQNKALLIALAASLGTVALGMAAVAAAQAIMAAGGIAAFIMQMVRSTQLWTAAQWLLNTAFWANPIVWIIAGIAVLIGLMVLAYQKSESFRNVMDALGAGIAAVWTGIIWPVLQAIWNFIKNVYGPIYSWLWNSVISPVLSWIGQKFKELWTVVSPVLNQLADWIKTKVVPVIQNFWPVVKAVMDQAGSKIKGVWNDWIKPSFEALKLGVDAVKSTFETVVSGITKTWESLKDKVSAPIKFVVNDIVRDKLVNGWNTIAGKLHLPTWDYKGWSEGGYTGALDPKAVAGFVHGDEHVIKSSSRRRIEARHPGLLDQMNRTGQVPGYAEGGQVSKVQLFLSKLLSKQGSRYVLGASHSPAQWKNPNQNVFDCSGFMQWGLTQAGVAHNGGVAATMGRGARQIGLSAAVNTPGAFLYKTSNPHAGTSGHIVASLGNGKTIEAMGTKYGVRQGNANGRFEGGSMQPGLSGSMTPEEQAALAEALANSDGGGMLNAVAWGLKKLVSPIFDGASTLLNTIVEKVGTGAATDLAKGFGTTGIKSVKDWLIAKIDEVFPPLAWGASGGGDAGEGDDSAPTGGGVSRWTSLVEKALEFVGLTPSGYLTAVTLKRMQQESGGNPKAINNWDSNAKKGTPSKGLMQVIDPTFKRYSRAPYNRDIWDPMSNVTASMFYALARYGSLPAAYGRKGGYALGTRNATAGLHWVGERGPELVRFRGGETVTPLRDGRMTATVDPTSMRAALEGMTVNVDGMELTFTRLASDRDRAKARQTRQGAYSG